MGLPRSNRTKYGVSLQELADRTGMSLSKLKRVSAKTPEVSEALLEGKPTEQTEEPADEDGGL